MIDLFPSRPPSHASFGLALHHTAQFAGLPLSCVCFITACVFYYCRTYYKAVRVGGGGEWRTCAMRDGEPRPDRPTPTTHCVCVCICVCVRARARERDRERASERERARESERERKGARGGERERERERARESERESLCVCVRMYMYVASAIFSRNLPLSIIFSLSWTRHPCHTGDSCATDKQGN